MDVIRCPELLGWCGSSHAAPCGGAWAVRVSQLNGLVRFLVMLGPTNASLVVHQIGPVGVKTHTCIQGAGREGVSQLNGLVTCCRS